jgi:hypothetical protein
METIKAMPDYEEALQAVKDKVKEQEEKQNAPKLEV